MKRSEAINIIANFLYELNVDAEDCNEKAEPILKALEEAGMLPPDCNFYNDEYGNWNHWEIEEKDEISD